MRGTGVKRSVDPYSILEVSPRASQTVVKAAYQALIKANHPDKGGDSKYAARLNAAYAQVSDPTKRAEYDRSTDPKTGTTIGNFRVLELIAEGGFGCTYKGEHVINKQVVCIKHCSMVSSAHDEVLISECNAIWDLRHHSLPAMRDMVRLDDGSLALIMSYIEGPTIEKVVEKAGKIDPEHVAWMTERTLNALLYLHHYGVVHGDLKPQNIIVQPQEHMLTLVDFGLSMVKPRTAEKAKGYTPFYAPPEQIAGKTLLPASDYYSLGMVMIYCLCGGNMKAVERMEVPAKVPAPMQAFIKSLISHDILARPQGDLFEVFRDVRLHSFGRARTGMTPIPGF